MAKRSLLIALFLLCAFCGVGLSQPAERFFDQAEVASGDIRIAITYPTPGTLKSLVTLREEGLVPAENVLIVGLYHEKEKTKYERSYEFVNEKNLDWVRFHQLEGRLSPDSLFQGNRCSTDFESIFKKSDGIIFYGGADIPPDVYGEKLHLLTKVATPYRHYLEVSFAYHLVGGFKDDYEGLLEQEPDFPVLCICLGLQTLNVAAGGTLIQDIWSVEYGKMYIEDVIALGEENWHTNPYARFYRNAGLIGYFMHPIELKKRGMFCESWGFTRDQTPYVVSAHHQAIGKRGKGIRVIATSTDRRVVEAIEHEAYPNVLGVQFHPDFTILWDADRRFRFTPDGEEKSLRSIMDVNPPSLEFNRKIWFWFFEKAKENHDRRVRVR